MPDYSIEQLVEAARTAGFSGPDLRTAVAVSLAENSGRNLTAVNSSSVEYSVGPWQINQKAWGNTGLFSTANLMTLEGSARAAKYIRDVTGGFQDWTTYTGGAYSAFLGLVDLALNSIGGIASSVTSGLGNAVGGSLPNLNPLSAASGIFGPLITVITTPINLLVKILTWFTQERHYWQMAFVAGGLVLTGLGIAMFMSTTEEGKAAISAAAKVA